MKRPRIIRKEDGVSLIELLVVIALVSLAMTGIVKLLILSMGTQQQIDADFRAQQDVRQAQYDLEENLGEAKRQGVGENQYPIFQSDLLSVPDQRGNWVTYLYATPPGAEGPTIVRIFTDSKPSLPITVLGTDKQLINVMPGQANQYATVERINGGPLFTYYEDDDSPASFSGSSVQTPRHVRSIQINFRVSESDSHAMQDPVDASIRVNLRNY